MCWVSIYCMSMSCPWQDCSHVILLILHLPRGVTLTPTAIHWWQPLSPDVRRPVQGESWHQGSQSDITLSGMPYCLNKLLVRSLAISSKSASFVVGTIMWHCDVTSRECCYGKCIFPIKWSLHYTPRFSQIPMGSHPLRRTQDVECFDGVPDNFDENTLSFELTHMLSHQHTQFHCVLRKKLLC